MILMSWYLYVSFMLRDQRWFRVCPKRMADVCKCFTDIQIIYNEVAVYHKLVGFVRGSRCFCMYVSF